MLFKGLDFRWGLKLCNWAFLGLSGFSRFSVGGFGCLVRFGYWLFGLLVWITFLGSFRVLLGFVLV